MRRRALCAFLLLVLLAILILTLQVQKLHLGRLQPAENQYSEDDGTQHVGAVGGSEILPYTVATGDSPDTIFVNIASFRDEECGPTIVDIYEKARKPQNIFVGVAEQNLPGDPKCVSDYFQKCQQERFCATDQIRVRSIKPSEARGPTYGRYLSSLLYRGEKYVMIIDSHNRFTPWWDVLVISMYNGLPAKKAVLSHYPESWLKDKKDFNLVSQYTSFQCGASFTHFGFVKFKAIIVSKSQKCRPSPFAAAGFIFASGSLTEEVPFDPHLPYLFDGEEILYSVRMWTHGWDIFSPCQSILFHYYYRPNSKKIWEAAPDWSRIQQESAKRVQYFLEARKPDAGLIIPLNTTDEKITVDKGKYGLGNTRTLQQYYEYAGIDPVRRTVRDWCSNPEPR